MSDKITEAAQSGVTAFIGAAVAGAFGLAVWVVRTLFTNERRISILEADLRHRDTRLERIETQVSDLNDTGKDAIAKILDELRELRK